VGLLDVLGIVGSPRKNERTDTLVQAALDGAKSKGVKTKKIFLIDYEIPQYTAGAQCPDELNRLCEDAGAIVLGAPVYYGDINGLTIDFLDVVKILNSNGKPALGIAIAGGTGKGLLSGIQSLYHIFYHRQMRGIQPIPASRFNFEEAIGDLKKSGEEIAELSQIKNPFPGETSNDRWGEVLAYYSSVKYLDSDPVDEYIMLAKQLIKISSGTKKIEAQAELDKTFELLNAGDRSEAARHVAKSYQILYY
jgi:multimeric flavodoxin WrbA